MPKKQNVQQSDRYRRGADTRLRVLSPERRKQISKRATDARWGRAAKKLRFKRPKPRNEAKALGLPRYSTGKPCKNGHDAERHTATGKCVECTRLHRLRQYHNGPEKARARKRKYDDKNRAKVNARQRAAAKANPERSREIRERWLAKHPGWTKQWWQKYYQDNLKQEKLRGVIKAHRRRKAEGSFTSQDVVEIREAQDDRCAMPNCRAKLHGGGHLDHIVPIARGGTNYRRNIQILCVPCNLKKKDKDPLDHVRSLGFLV